MVMATPLVSAVKEIFPKSKLSILTKDAFISFWKGFPGVHQVIPLGGKGLDAFFSKVSEIKKHHFDAALIMPTSFSSAFLPFTAGIPTRIGWGAEGRDFLLTQVVPRPHYRKVHLVWEFLDLARRGFGKTLPSNTARLSSSRSAEVEREAWKLFAKEKIQTKRGLIALVPGAAYGPTRRWPLPYWIELIKRLLKERKESFLILGGKEEEAYLGELQHAFPGESKGRIHSLVGRTSVPVLAAVLAKCRVLVSNDTGPMHLAAAVGTPSVVLYASTSALWTQPFGSELIYHKVNCSPCFQRTCPIGYLCLHKITVEEVFQAALRNLKKPRKITAIKAPMGILR